MKQYRVFYRREGAQDWGALEPIVHAQIYDVPEVNAAVQLCRENPWIGAICVKVEGAMFNIILFEQAAEAPKSFVL